MTEYFQHCIWTTTLQWEHIKVANQGWNCTWCDRHMEHPTDVGTACNCQPVFQSPRSKFPWKPTYQTHTAIVPQGCNMDLCVSQESTYLCILMGRGKKEEGVFFREHKYCELPTHTLLDCRSQQSFLSLGAPPPSGYYKLGLLKAQLQHLCAQKKWASIPRRQNEPMTWRHGSLPAKSSLLLRNQLGKSLTVPFPEKKLRMSVFKGLQPSTSTKNTIFSEMPNIQAIKAFVWYFHNQISGQLHSCFKGLFVSGWLNGKGLTGVLLFHFWEWGILPGP